MELLRRKRPVLAKLPLQTAARPISKWRKIVEDRARNIHHQNAIADEMGRREIRSELQRLEGLLHTGVHPALRQSIVDHGRLLHDSLKTPDPGRYIATGGRQ